MESYKQDFLGDAKSYTDTKADEVNNNLATNYVTVTNYNSGIDIAKQNILSTVSQEYATKASVTDLNTNITNNYASKSELQQTTNSITAKFSESGGYNLLRNKLNESEGRLVIETNYNKYVKRYIKKR